MKYLKYIQYLLFAISIVLLAVFYLTQTGSMTDKILDINLFWAYALIGIGAALALIFPLAKAFKTKKGFITLLILIAGVVVVIGGCYLLAPGTPIEINQEVSAATFKFTDTALYVTYVFVAASILALLWSAIRNSFKR
jgi:TRAP-type C4-dicarboxylate transport system permease small subunit